MKRKPAGAFTADRGFFFEKMIQQYGAAAFALFPLPEGGGFLKAQQAATMPRFSFVIWSN